MLTLAVHSAVVAPGPVLSLPPALFAWCPRKRFALGTGGSGAGTPAPTVSGVGHHPPDPGDHPGDLCHRCCGPGDPEALLAQHQSWCWGSPWAVRDLSLGERPPWGRARATMRGGARTTIGGGARLQCGAEPGPHEWEVRTRQRGGSSPTELAGGSCGTSAHGLPQPCHCLPTTSVPALLLWGHPVLAPTCPHPLPAFAPSQPCRWEALGRCVCPLGMKAFCRICSLSAAHGMAPRQEQQLCAPTFPYLCTLGQAFGHFLPVLPGLLISSPSPTPCTSQGLPLLTSTWS